MLATAMVRAQHNNGQYFSLRAVVDPGSTTTIITEQAAQLLGLNRQFVGVGLSGIGAQSQRGKGEVFLKFKPDFPSDKTFETTALILKQITSLLPNERIDVKSIETSHFDSLHLADPWFFEPREIDILLGQDILNDLMLGGVILGYPLAQETHLGWIVSGKLFMQNYPPQQLCLMAQKTNDKHCDEESQFVQEYRSQMNEENNLPNYSKVQTVYDDDQEYHNYCELDFDNFDEKF